MNVTVRLTLWTALGLPMMAMAADGAAADWRGMIGNGTGKPGSEIGVPRMKSQERGHRFAKVRDVFGLGLVTASSIRLRRGKHRTESSDGSR
jgi:hypothetical protein